MFKKRSHKTLGSGLIGMFAGLVVAGSVNANELDMKNRCSSCNPLEFNLAESVLLYDIQNPVSVTESKPRSSGALRVGVRDESFIWSYGPVYHNSSFYIQASSKIFSDRIDAYLEASGNNPVIEEGFTRPRNNETTDISPNTHLMGFAGGLNITLYDNLKWAVRLGIRYDKISEFDEHQNWYSEPDERTHLHVDGISGIGSSACVERNSEKFGAYLGISAKSTYASGRALTYEGNSVSESEARYDEFNQRDKVSIRGMCGGHYGFDKNKSLNLDIVAGESGGSVDIGFSKRF